MPAKKAVTKNTKPKSNIAKSTLVSSKKKINKTFVAVIILVFAAALGYLFVRLSKASGEVPCTGPNMRVNCFYTASQGRGSGGSMQAKEGGTMAWVSSGESSFTFTDKVQAGISVRYCLQIKFIGSEQVNWTLEWKNTSAGTSATRQGSDSPSDTPRIRCVPVNQTIVNGSSGALTNQQIKFSTGSKGGAVVYKMVREWQGTGAVNSPVPGAKPVTPDPTQAPPPPTQTPVGLCHGLNAFGIGNQGDCVRLIQQQLVNLGYNVGPNGVDGVYGQETANAVKVYQQKAGLPQDGVVGTQTWNSMFGANPARKQ